MSVLPTHSLWVSHFSPPRCEHLSSGRHHAGHWISLLTGFCASSLVCLLWSKDSSTANGLKNYPFLDPLMTPHWLLIKAQNSLSWHKYKTLHNLSLLTTPFFLSKCLHFMFHAPASLKFFNPLMISVLQVIPVTCAASLTTPPSELDLFREAFPGKDATPLCSHSVPILSPCN